ncbi:MAG: DNA polymerase III subunit [Candidatus Omnitrophica bacterium]|nr:DNA polymerase III subunit [Candidatus Omnitrophota bacterium]
MSFQDIKGHDNITLFFKKTLQAGRLSHAYLFLGPDGVGKALTAHMLSKALNCVSKKGDCCDACAPCLKIENKNHPDVMWIEGGNSIDIDTIRNMQERISLRPYEARSKIYIIRDSHKMTLDAANCLLKTLEEPPLDSVIVLISSKPDELPLTVRSRCKIIKFGPLELKLRVGLAEKQGFSGEDALFLAKLAGSGAAVTAGRKGALEYKNRVIDEFNSKAALLDDTSFIFKEEKEGIIFALSIVETWFRDMLLLKSGAKADFVVNYDRLAQLKEIKDAFSEEQLEGILKEVDDAIYYADRNVGPKIALNNLKIRIGDKITA